MTYEYYCFVCKKMFEIEQKISDEPLSECPECKCGTIKRMISGGNGFLLKGETWYKDGYQSKTNKDSV